MKFNRTGCRISVITGFIILLFIPNLFSQIEMPVFGNHPAINGYMKQIQGEVWPYFSAFPDYAKEAMLTRCTDGKKAIEWETAPIPESTKGDYAYFSWVAAHSTGTSKGTRNFDLYINNELALTFTTQMNSYPPYWTFAGKDSTRIVFELRKKDGAQDAHGVVYLRVPLKKYGKGKPLTLKVVGQNQNSSDWYMTFKYSFEEKIDIEPWPFVLKNTKKPQQTLFISVLHFGADNKLKLKIDQGNVQTFVVKNGINSFELPVEIFKNKDQHKIKASIGNVFNMDKTFTLDKVKKRDIYFIHHSHNDIGYSHIQEDVEKIQNKNISDALSLIEKTKNYPEGARFIWNIESMWAVENFLNIASPKVREQFFTAVRNGQIGLSAFYANILTGLCRKEEMNWIMDYAFKLSKENNLPLNSAMMTDIPGMNWAMVHAMSSYGIRYFSNGPNYIESMPDKGDRIGSTLRELGDKPFWWKSPDAKDSVLVWTGGKGYSSWHGFAPGAVYERGKKKIASYLHELDEKKYPYDMVQWRYNIVSDNGTVDSTISDFIKEWNEKYESPTIHLTNVSDLFSKFEKKYGNQIPVFSGDFTPYWEDGAYSTAREEGEARVLSAKITSIEERARNLRLKIDGDLLYRAKRDIVLWHEHTWGSWNSISDPDNPFSVHQWNYKKAFLDSAKIYIDRLDKPKMASFKKNALASGIKMNQDETTGAINSLIFQGREMINTRKYSGLGSVIYHKGLNPDSLYSGSHHDGLTHSYQIEGCNSVRYDFRVMSEDEIVLDIVIDKKKVREKESMHIPFPFNISKPMVRIGAADSYFTPENGQIPGSCKDFFCAENWIDVSNDEIGVTIVSPQNSIWEIGDMVNEEKNNNGFKTWKTEAHSSSTLFAYILNNYWHTNYVADQSGEISFTFYLKFHGQFSLEDANKFARKMIY